MDTPPAWRARLSPCLGTLGGLPRRSVAPVPAGRKILYLKQSAAFLQVVQSRSEHRSTHALKHDIYARRRCPLERFAYVSRLVVDDVITAELAEYMGLLACDRVSRSRVRKVGRQRTGRQTGKPAGKRQSREALALICVPSRPTSRCR